MTQMTLLGKSKEQFEKEKDIESKKIEYPIEFCLEAISKEPYLWDMRCWDKYHNKEEVMRWLDNKDRWGNCGYAIFLINNLLENHKVSKKIVADAIMLNTNIQFKNRIVKCWSNPTDCPKYKEQGNYGNNICKECK